MLEPLETRRVLSFSMNFAFDVQWSPGGDDAQDHVHEPDTHVLATDPYGNDFYSEPKVSMAAPAGGGAEGGTGGDDTLWQGYDLTQTFSLHSRPAAEHVIYLDFDGHVTSGTYWNDAFTGGNDIVTAAWSSDADATSFSDSEKAFIQRVWARVSEDYAPLDIDITTEEPPLEDLVHSGGADTQWGTRVVIGPNSWFSPAGGVAYVGSFMWDTDTPAFVFNSAENGVTESISHEAGHTLGLNHDGDATTAYHTGYGNGPTSWGPIMGAPYGRVLTQWSKGEYLTANNIEDDLAIISENNGFGFRPDDYGSDLANAETLIPAGASDIAATYGIIETSTDYDVFSFQADAGTALISIDPLAIGPNLDILAELFNASGSLIASSNPLDAIDAELSYDLPSQGTYFVRISGTGKGDPLVEGYSDYGSLGNYRITGTVPAFPGDNAWPVAADDQAATSMSLPVIVDVVANDTDADDDTLTVQSVTQGSHGAVVLSGDSAVTYTPNAGFTGQDEFTYTVVDGQGGYDTGQVTITVIGGTVPVNGGFESGLSGWETSGAVSVQTSALGEIPAAGQYQAVVTNENALGGDVSVADMETFLGLPSGSLEDLAPGTATAGSALRQIVTVAANQEITFQYNFLTNESTPDPNYNDFSFFTVSGPGASEAMLLGDTNAGTFSDSASGYKESTGYQSFSYTFTQNGNYTIGFGVADSKDASYDSALAIDTVSTGGSPNNPPTAAGDGAVTNEDSATTIDVLANDSDPDGDTLDVIGVSQPAWGIAVLNANDTVTYTPDANFHGDDTFTYTLGDGNGGQATGTVSVTVSPVNDPPVAGNDGLTTLEDSVANWNVLANDTDIDGDVLNVTGVTQAAHGTVTLNADNTITYAPEANYNGSDTFSYTLDDGNDGQATGTVFVTIVPENDAPVAVDDVSDTTQDTPVTIDVLDNDSDVDGDTLTIASVQQPASGSVAVNGNQTVTFTPDPGFFGNLTFSYTVTDSHGGQATADVTVSVSMGGTPSDLINGGFEEGQSGWGTHGDASTQTAAAFGQAPAAGLYQAVLTNIDAAGGNVTVADLEAFLGVGSGALDGVAEGMATAGSAIRQTINVQAGEQLTFYYSFLTDESTPDSNYNDFSFFTVSGPGTSSAMLLADTQAPDFAVSGTAYKQSTAWRAYDYTFAAGGQYTIGFGVSDSRDTSYDSALLLDKMSIGGSDPNRPPVAGDDNPITEEDHAITIDVLANDSDPDGDPLWIPSVSQGASGTVTVNSGDSITYTPDPDYHGTDSFTYTVSDGHGGQATATVNVVVVSVNDDPTAVDDSATTDRDVSVTIPVLSNDSDPDGGVLDVLSVTAARNGALVINADNTVTYTPNAGYVGQDSFTYSLSDGQDGQATAAVAITVAAPAADVLNGGFEQDLMYWQAIGHGTAETSSFGETPVAGSKQGAICSSNAHGGNISVADMESFLGLPSGAIDGVTSGSATAGSAIRQVITVSGGVELVFSYNFLTDENTPSSIYNDFAFFSVVGPGVQEAVLLADTYAATFAASSSTFNESTGYLTMTYTFPQAGQYTIGFGVSDSRDTSYDSALLLDRVALQASSPQAAAPSDPAGTGGGDSNPPASDGGGLLSGAGSPEKMGPQLPQPYSGWVFAFSPIKAKESEFYKPGAFISPGTTTPWEGLVDQVLTDW